MKHIFHQSAILRAGALVAVLMVVSNVHAQCVSVDGGVQTQALYAGQTLDIGTVSVEVLDTNLVVTYQTDSGWQLSETHLWVGDDLSDMPQTRKGSPKIGNFPYASGTLSGSSVHVETVPLSVIGFNCPSTDQEYYIAAHAAVQRVDSSGSVVQSETAWSDGSRYVERGMWGTYSSTVLTCDCDGSKPPVEGSCETAFAYSGGTNVVDGDITSSFLDIDENGESAGDFNRWGWSNGAVSPSTDTGYAWDIYAGAGQSDINKGTLVGTLYVLYDGVTAEVTFEIDAPYYMEENHLYVGSEILPRDVTGGFTVAPGQYPTIHDSLSGDNQYLDTYTVAASGAVYVVAHATVCGF